MDVTLTHNGVSVEVLEGPYLREGAPTAEAVTFYSRLVEQIDVLRRYAADRLLSLYNDVWLDDEIGVLDVEGVVRRIANPSVTIYDEIGAATVYFDDGDLFGGHYIQVSIDNHEPVDASIVG